MAITEVSQPVSATRRWTVDATGTINTGDASSETVGTKIVQLQKNGATIEFTPKGRVLGAGNVSVGWIALAYQNLTSGADVAGTTPINTDGLYAVRCDVGVEMQLDVTTASGGTADILVRQGKG
jgi:hypothetical protein